MSEHTDSTNTAVRRALYAYMGEYFPTIDLTAEWDGSDSEDEDTVPPPTASERCEDRKAVTEAREATGGRVRRRSRSRPRSRSRKGSGITGGRRKKSMKRRKSRGRGGSIESYLMKLAMKRGLPAVTRIARRYISGRGGRKKSMKRRRSSSRGRGGFLTGGASSAWQTHVQKVSRSHPGMSLGQVSRMASRTY